MSGVPRGLRLAVYTDYAYHRLGDQVYSERAFSVFVSGLAESDRLESLTVIGRLDPTPARSRYPLGGATRFVALPFYRRLSEPASVARAMAGSLRVFWRTLGEVDAVWLLGPHPLAVAFAALATARRKRVVLGIRQDSREYVRNRHPGSRAAQAAAAALDGLFRLLARRCDVVAVGPQIAGQYRRSRRLLEIAVSLVSEEEIVAPDVAARKDYEGAIRVLTVGRIDPEKNPLMLADVLAALGRNGNHWSLVVCGEGSLEAALAERIEGLGLEGQAELRGYVALDAGLRELYRDSHALLHVSWTEGLPQILFEAFAAGLPVVATDVGGIGEAVAPAVSLVPPGDPEAAAEALQRLISEPQLRSGMIREGNRIAQMRTIEAETTRLAAFLAGD